MPGNCKSKQGLDPNSLGAVFAPCSLLEVECVKARDASRSQSLMGSSDMERILEYHFDANLAADERKNHRFFGWESNQRMDVTASVQYKDLRTRYWRPTRHGVQMFIRELESTTFKPEGGVSGNFFMLKTRGSHPEDEARRHGVADAATPCHRSRPPEIEQDPSR